MNKSLTSKIACKILYIIYIHTFDHVIEADAMVNIRS